MSRVDKSEAIILRNKALALWEKKYLKSDSRYFNGDELKLFHELEVHQIELEIQNEELITVSGIAHNNAEKYSKLYDFAPSGYFTLSNEGDIIELNLCASNILGKVRTRLQQSKLGFFVSDDTRPIFNLFLEKVFQSKTNETCEVTLLTNAGILKHVYISGIITDNGEQCLISVIDITDKKETEQKLINANKELVFQNEEKEKRAAELAIAEIKAEKNEELEKLTAALILANKELVFQNEEKEKQAAELILAKDKVEEHDRLKTAFLANMSHEIRTPMNGILGFTELLKKPELTGEKQQLYISMIEKGGVRMLNIINDIINISKIESDQMEVSLSESNVNEQIEYIYNFYKTEVQRKGMQISFHNILPSIEAVIKTDREKIFAILINLVNNAIKYSNKGTIVIGYVLKPVMWPFDHEDREPAELEFYVKDTGIGIPHNQIEAIFERFVQADNGNKRAYQGAGLGLSISKAYVEMLGGKIWVESEVGEGSTFYFTIPYNNEPEEYIAVKNVVFPDKEEPEIKKLKILITDDDESSAMLLTEIAKKFTKEVLYAGTGVEAVEACRKNPDIDLVLMDIQMPIMDGYEATKQIRLFNSNIVIIAQTAYLREGDRAKAIEVGCNDYIPKPINQTRILDLIKLHFQEY